MAGSKGHCTIMRLCWTGVFQLCQPDMQLVTWSTLLQRLHAGLPDNALCNISTCVVLQHEQLTSSVCCFLMCTALQRRRTSDVF